MRTNLAWVDPTLEDVIAQTFRVERRIGSVCCEGHHMIMIASTLIADAIDADEMFAGVRSCASMRMVDLPVGEWLREAAEHKCDVLHSSEHYQNLLKKTLDF